MNTRTHSMPFKAHILVNYLPHLFSEMDTIFDSWEEAHDYIVEMTKECVNEEGLAFSSMTTTMLMASYNDDRSGQLINVCTIELVFVENNQLNEIAIDYLNEVSAFIDHALAEIGDYNDSGAVLEVEKALGMMAEAHDALIE